MSFLSDDRRIRISGPFWEADADLMQQADPLQHSALRTLFYQYPPRTVKGVENVLVPGTVLVLVRVQEVRVTPGPRHPGLHWQRSAAPPELPLDEALATGELSLLLVELDPAGWPTNDTAPSPRITCLAGEIGLDGLTALDGAREAVYAAAALTPPGASDPLPNARRDAARLYGTLSVQSSGISIYGRVHFPWLAADERLAGVFHLARLFPDVLPDMPQYRLSIEIERLTAAERATLIAAWRRLSEYINPPYPQHPRPGDLSDTPAWVTLEITDPASPPQLFWKLSDWQMHMDRLPLFFERGEMTVLLSDQSPYDEQHPPAALARYTPDVIAIELNSDELTVSIGAPISEERNLLRYTAQRHPQESPQVWREQYAIDTLEMSFSATQVAQFLRETRQLAEPDWPGPQSGQTVDPPLLWGFLALHDGWAHLPFLNLSEQIYLDAGLARATQPAPAIQLAGAAAYRNTHSSRPQPYPSEQPWSLTITNVEHVAGRWILRAEGNGFLLERVALNVLRPDLSISGLLWLARAAPTVADALPGLDNWMSGLAPVVLRSWSSERDLLPSPILLELHDLSFQPRRQEEAADAPGPAPLVAALAGWALHYTANEPVLQRLCGPAPAPFPPDTFATAPLVWRRHPHLPMIQALPLTQNQSPPNHPAASRQLFPLPLTIRDDQQPIAPAAWRFGVPATDDNPAHGASQFPILLSEVQPAAAWWAWHDLPLVALSLPGLFLDPATAAERLPIDGHFLPAGYRFDLPYTDEVQALARAPQKPRDEERLNPPPAAPFVEGQAPLERTTFARYWQQLSEQASLARADAVDALLLHDGQPHIDGLIEPYRWPVQISADLENYPGTLGFANPGDTPAPAAAEHALRGISGAFAPENGTMRQVTDSPAAFQVTAGSMAAAAAADSYRDQRGLRRSATRRETQLLLTPVQLEQAAGPAQPYELASLLEPLRLSVGAAQPWLLWFRDLPLAQNEAGQRFARDSIRSASAADVNDPEGLGRDYNYLQGYEWRLGAEDTSADIRLSLFGLDFFPLTLDRVDWGTGGAIALLLSGRLQVPLPDHPELEDLDNIVQLQFSADPNGQLQLAALTPPDTRITWPLEANGNESGAGPRITWQQQRLDPAAGILTLLDARLEFFLFDTLWKPALPELVFGAANITLSDIALASATDGPVTPALLALALQSDGRHSAALTLTLQLGSGVDERPEFSASVEYELLNSRQVSWHDGALFAGLLIAPEQRQFSSAEQTLQFAWQSYVDDEPRQFLPGMPLVAPDAPGCAVVQFAVQPNGDVPLLSLNRAFVETLLTCRWGRMLQDTDHTPLALADVFAASAGDLTIGYTLHGDVNGFSSGFLLNGMLEIRNLISWPAAMQTTTADTGSLHVTLPATRGTPPPPLDHRRHSLRVLLNQQDLPAAQVRAADDNVLFSLAPGAAWQFLAVVEHQMLDLRLTDTTAEPGAERRWNVLQEVRLLLPKDLATALRGSGLWQAPGAGGQVAPLEQRSSGIFNQRVREEIADALDSTNQILMVEASVPLWLGASMSAPARPGALQFLPGGSQYGILSRPQDFLPSDLQNPNWLVLACHFLGRLQNDAALTEDANIIQGDPIASIAARRNQEPDAELPALLLALCNRGDAAPAALAVAGLDTVSGRQFARLDPHTLEENWFRIQTPPPETAPELLASITASLPDTPARLSRATALQRAFTAFRSSYPPGTSASEEATTASASEDLLTWQPGALFAPTYESNPGGTEGLQVLYLFDEGSGDIVHDQSSHNEPINLQIADLPGVTWLPGGGLRVDTQTIIASTTPAERLSRACRETGAISVEVWIRPTNTDAPQQGPARIVTLSQDTNRRNVMLGQGLYRDFPPDLFVARLRSTATTDNGLPALTSNPGTARAERTHVVYTRSADGTARLYINGVQESPGLVVEDRFHDGMIDGDVSNWNLDYRLALANELTRDRPWLGEYHMVAIFNRALTPEEIAQRARGINRVAYPWLETGLLLHTADFRDRSDAASSRQRRHPATTLLPTAHRPARSLPLSFAVSPYLGLEYYPVGDQTRYQPVLTIGEVLCQNAATGRLRPVANRAWDTTDEIDLDAEAQRWARAVHRQQNPDSPVLLLRYRTIARLPEDQQDGAALLRTSYGFTVLTPPRPAALTRRSVPLRAPVETLRFREGQYGGAQMPDTVQPFELAPPQTVGVQPICLHKRAVRESATLDWPWGLSALRVSLRYSAERRAIIGGAGAGTGEHPPLTLWWSTLQHMVQYRSGERSERPAAGLPPQFRATALSSLLAVVAPPLPDHDALLHTIKQSDRIMHWQPVLPGALRYLSSGMRPGVFFALRSQVLRQQLTGPRAGSLLGSGSVVVQHRAPRPVPLPPNRTGALGRALQTWASQFAPQQLLDVSGTPSDEAFFAADQLVGSEGRQANWRVQLRLRYPDRGAITAEWSREGQIRFLVVVERDRNDQAQWSITCELIDGNTSLFFAPREPEPLELSGDDTRREENIVFELIHAAGVPDGLVLPDADSEPSPREVALATLRGLLVRRSPGDQLWLRVRISDISVRDGFEQQLSFPLRIGGGNQRPLPLEPVFVQFEDPEYNRRLASEPARVSGQISQIVAINGGQERQLRIVQLTTDRRQYNADSDLFLRYDWDHENEQEGELDIVKIEPDGIEQSLTTSPIAVAPNTLMRLSLPEVLRQHGNRVHLAAGDQIELRLTPRKTQPGEQDQQIVMRLPIVAEPLVPLPEAGYALLRHTQQGGTAVECVRFAWGPAASRVELVNGDDLRRGLVRRRAVFQWQDSARPGSGARYAIQKLAVNGATHIPSLERFQGSEESN